MISVLDPKGSWSAKWTHLGAWLCVFARLRGGMCWCVCVYVLCFDAATRAANN